MSRPNVMSCNRPSWVAEEPSKTGRSAVHGFGITRQNGAFCLNQQEHTLLSGMLAYSSRYVLREILWLPAICGT